MFNQTFDISNSCVTSFAFIHAIKVNFFSRPQVSCVNPSLHRLKQGIVWKLNETLEASFEGLFSFV